MGDGKDYVIGKTNNVKNAKERFNHLNILKIFLEAPNKEYTLKEVQEKLSLSYEPAYRYMSELNKKNYVTQRIGDYNTKFFKLNLNNPEAVNAFKWIQESNKKETGHDMLLANPITVKKPSSNIENHIFTIVIMSLLIAILVIYNVDIQQTGFVISKQKQITEISTTIEQTTSVSESVIEATTQEPSSNEPTPTEPAPVEPTPPEPQLPVLEPKLPQLPEALPIEETEEDMTVIEVNETPWIEPMMIPLGIGILSNGNGFETYPAGTLVIPMDIPKQSTNPDDVDFLRAYGLIYRLLENNMSIDYIVSPNCAFFTAKNIDNQSKTYNESYCHGAFVITDPNTTTPQNEAWTYINSTLRTYYDSSRGIYPFAGVVIHNASSGYVNSTDRMHVRHHLNYAVFDPDDQGNFKATLDESYIPYTVLNETQIRAGALSNYSVLMIDHYDFTKAANITDLAAKIKRYTDNGGHLSLECLSVTTLEPYVSYFPGIKKGPGASGTIRVLTEEHPITQTHNLTGMDNEGGAVPTLDMSLVTVNYTILLVDNNYVSNPNITKMVGRFVNDNNSYVMYAGGHIGTRKGDALETPRNRIAVNNFIIYTTEIDLPPAYVTNLNESSVGNSWIEWNWTNPIDSDLNHTEIWINGLFYTNVSAPNSKINVTGLDYGTIYTISTRTVDNYGNINTTWVNDTARTLGDSTAPTISFISPTPASGTYSRNYISVNATASDAVSGLKNITIYLYNSTGLVNRTNSTTSYLFVNFTNLPDGTYYINATAYDMEGNKNSTETRSITLDTATPTITIVNPKNDTYSTNSIVMDVIFDVDAQTCWYSFNGGPNTTFTCGTTVNLTANSGLNNLTVYANDSLNNIGKSSVWFTIDTSKALNVVINSPANNTFTNNPTPKIILIATDRTYSTVNYSLYVYYANGSLYSIANTGTLANNTATTIVLSPELTLIGNSTTYKIIAVTNDSAPNYDNSSELFVTLQTPVLYLMSPANNYIDNDGQINFMFKFYDITYNTANCSLYLNNVYNQSNSTTKNNIATTFAVSGISEGLNKNWTIHCNMSPLISVNDTMFFSVDRTKPAITVQSPGNTTYGTTGLWFNVTINETGSWCGYSLDGTANVSLTNSSGNWNAQNSSMTEGAHSVIIYCNDSAGNINSSQIIYFVTDSAAPQWSNNITSPDSPATYAPGTSYQFNITWTDAVTVSKVIFEFNGINYTPSFNGDVYYITLTGLSANETGYNYRWYANDSANKWNSTSQLTYIINKAQNIVALYINGTQDDVSYIYPAIVNATGTSGSGTVYIYRDNVLLTSGSSPKTDISALAKDMYVYKVNATGNANYTDNPTGISYDVFITNAAGSCSLTFDKINPQIYGTSVKPSCICTNPETAAELYRNGSDVTATENNTATTLAAGTWEYICNSSTTQNYTSASNSSIFVITKAPTNITLYLNGTRGNRIYELDEFANFTTASNISGKTVYIYSDLPGVLTQNGTTPLTRTILLDTQGVFYVTGYSLEDPNYSASSETWFLTVQDTIAPTISNVGASPGTVNQTYDVIITADLTDNDAVYGGIVEITYPNGTKINYTMNAYDSKTWLFNFTDTLQIGQYNYSIYANDAAGNWNFSTGYSFSVTLLNLPVIMSTDPINKTIFDSGTATRTITVITNIVTECRYNTTDSSFEDMISFTNTNSTMHNFTITGLSDGNTYNYYISCKDLDGHKIVPSYVLSFSVASAPPPAPPGGSVGSVGIGAPTQRCGDNLCSNTEGCVSCPVDCGDCYKAKNATSGIELFEKVNGVNTGISDIDGIVLTEKDLVYTIKNNGNAPVENVTLRMVYPKDITQPDEIHYGTPLFWDIQSWLGWKLIGKIQEERLMKWLDNEILVAGVISPGEEIDVPASVIPPITKMQSADIIFQVLSKGVIITEDKTTIRISAPKAIVAADYIAEDDTIELYIAVNNRDNPNKLENVYLEFNVNDGKITKVYELFGPYSINAGDLMIIADKYKLSEDIVGKDYSMTLKVHNGLTLIPVTEVNSSLNLIER